VSELVSNLELLIGGRLSALAGNVPIGCERFYKPRNRSHWRQPPARVLRARL